MEVRLEGFEEAATALLAALEEEMPGAVDEVARGIAEEAAANHPYSNRTGLLEQRTVAGATEGRFSEDDLRGEVLGDTRYGRFVDEGTSRMAARPFLAPAEQRKQGASGEALEAGLRRAAERAGW